LVDGKFEENPANGGNGSRMAKPDKNDWYETVKVIMVFVRMDPKIFRIPAGFFDQNSSGAF
jgi:hypothetical protein